MAKMILAVMVLVSTNLFANEGVDFYTGVRMYQMMEMQNQLMQNAVEQSRYMGNTGGALPMRNAPVQQMQHSNPYQQRQVQPQYNPNQGYQGYGYGQ